MEVKRYELQLRKSQHQSLFTFFPNKTFDHDKKSWIVKSLSGSFSLGDRDSIFIKQRLAKILADIRKEKLSKLLEEEKVGEEETDPELLQLAQIYGISHFGRIERLVAPTEVEPDDIILIEPENASIDLFPHAWICDACYHYMVKNPFEMKAFDFFCPECYKNNRKTCTTVGCENYKKYFVAESKNCPSCGKEAKTIFLKQLSLMFVCKICGKQEEILPPGVPREKGPLFRCWSEKGCGGHYHFHRNPHELLSKAKWRCNECGDERPVSRWCTTCTDKTRASGYVRMIIRPASATYLMPKIASIVKIGEIGEVSEEILRKEAEWKLSDSDNLSDAKIIQVLRENGIEDMWLLPKVASFTINYGYSYYSFDTNVIINPYEVIERGKTKFKAFVIKTEGKGVYIKLNKDRLLKTIERLNKFNSYNEVAKEVLRDLNSKTAREFKEKGNPLFEIIHSFCHALRIQAPLITGLSENSFIEKVLINDGGFLILESQDVSAAGIDYLVKHRTKEWLLSAILRVQNCRYNCKKGCVKCLFINDFLCHPLLPTEAEKYFIPNSGLSRNLLLKYWHEK
jgi:hypothetical protein